MIDDKQRGGTKNVFEFEFIEDSENYPYCVDEPYCDEKDCLACIERNGKDSSRPHLFAVLRKRKWKKSQ